jgi:dienelactone hydrolase
MQINAPPFKCPASAEAFDRLRRKTLDALRGALGSAPFDDPPPLNPRVIYTSDDRAFWRKKVRYGNESDDVIWAWLLVPKDAHPDTPRPAVICLPGTFMTPNWGKDGPAGLAGPENAGDPEAYGADLARLGYITLCPDYPCAGERTSPGLRSHDTAELDCRFPTWTRVGLSAWDVSRAVDFLLTLPEVYPDRIGCTGWSQGGEMAVLGAALDSRIAVTASVCGWSPLRNQSEAIVDNLTRSYNLPHLRPFAESGDPLSFDLDWVAACIAPRPFLDVRASHDRYFSNRDDIAHAACEIRRVYQLLDVPERFLPYSFGGDHAHNAHAARETQAWFHKWLWTKPDR